MNKDLVHIKKAHEEYYKSIYFLQKKLEDLENMIGNSVFEN